MENSDERIFDELRGLVHSLHNKYKKRAPDDICKLIDILDNRISTLEIVLKSWKEKSWKEKN